MKKHFSELTRAIGKMELLIGFICRVILNQHLNPTIVMGLSGKVDKLINVDKAKELNLPVIKRFSGGGTVVVDHSTFCLTFILNKVNCYHYLYFEE